MSILTKTGSEYIKDTSREYAIYVCDQRSIPSVCDGLKSGQRKALWTIRNRSDKIKTVSLSGEMISANIYTHGDVSASDAISLLAAPFCNNIPLLEGIGTFGTRTAPRAFGAPRYTYVKRYKATEELVLKDLDVVPLKENYDGSTLEPIHFLPIIPMVLLNGVSGIAVGWSTEILPHNLKDLVDAVVSELDGKKMKKLCPSYSYLDIGVSNIEGNSWEFIGKFKRIDTSTVEIISLPPDKNLEKFRKNLDLLEEADKINSYEDNSAENISIQVKFKRGILNDMSDEDVIDILKLRSRETERFVVLGFDNNSIKQYETAEQLVKEFVAWRLSYYVKRYEKLLADNEYDLKYWIGLRDCFDKGLPKKLGKVKNKAEVIDNITKITKQLDDDQKNRIASLPTYRWNEEYYQEVLEKINQTSASIIEYTDILADEKKIKAIYKEEVLKLKKL